MSESAAQRQLRTDPRTATAAAGERISLTNDEAKVLLEVLGPGETVRALYHNGWGDAVLTRNGLILLRHFGSPKATRVPKPFRILRRTYGMFDSVEILVEGRPHKLHGSKLDPKGELLQARGNSFLPNPRCAPAGGSGSSPGCADTLS